MLYHALNVIIGVDDVVIDQEVEPCPRRSPDKLPDVLDIGVRNKRLDAIISRQNLRDRFELVQAHGYPRKHCSKLRKVSHEQVDSRRERCKVCDILGVHAALPT
jgi:hypothetical protein